MTETEEVTPDLGYDSETIQPSSGVQKIKNKRARQKHVLGAEMDSLAEKEGYLEQLVFDSKKIVTTLERNSRKRGGDVDSSDDELDDKEDVVVPVAKKRQPAWVDDNDENKKIVLPSLAQPSWCSLDAENKESSDEDSETDDLVKTARNYRAKSVNLPRGQLDFKPCRDLNFDGKSEGASVRCVEFHPTAQVGLVAGNSGTATLYQVDGKTNPRIQSLKFDKFSIATAHFTVSGDELVVSSADYLYYYVYDLHKGKATQIPTYNVTLQDNLRKFQVSPNGKLFVFYGRSGYISLFDSRTKEFITNLKTNGETTSVTFNRDGTRMFCTGVEGMVYIWDMDSRQCIHKFYDDGCITGTSIAFSPNGQYLACGSDSGVVNVYDSSTLHTSHNPQPIKAILNMTTSVTQLKFNATTEILGLLSNDKENAFKMVHLPSLTVFENFPALNFNMRTPLCLDFSLSSGYLTVTNNKGKAYLWRLRHYSNY